MKILELNIETPNDIVLKKIKFDEIGVSYIYGDIQQPNEMNGTINSLGKTLLLKFIDYIFGANEDSNIVKKELVGYKLKAIVLYNGKKFNISRTLGIGEISIDGIEYTLDNYKTFFDIKRSLYAKQFILHKKATELGSSSNINKEDIIACLKLLKLLDLVEKANVIYESQDKLELLKKNKNDLIDFCGDFNEKQIAEKIYYIDKDVETLSTKIEKIADKIKNIKIASVQKDIIEEYANKSTLLKNQKRDYENNKFEYERLLQFVESSNKIDILSEHIVAIFEKAKQEVPEMVKKKLEEVELFHKKVYEERKEFLIKKSQIIKEEMEALNNEIEKLSLDVDKIGNIISEDKVYRESTELYQKYSKDLQQLKFTQGQLSQIKNVDGKIQKEDESLTRNFEQAAKIRNDYNELVEQYRDFIYNITKNIYGEDVYSYFDITIRKKHSKNRPVKFEFNLKGDTGEGVSEVKKNIIDYLICKFNDYMDIMIQDSSCFNGIDPRQIVGMLNQINIISLEENKQVIISINKYQLGTYEDAIKMVAKNSKITLSEKDKLMGFEF